jgi:hypothetical protein
MARRAAPPMFSGGGLQALPRGAATPARYGRGTARLTGMGRLDRSSRGDDDLRPRRLGVAAETNAAQRHGTTVRCR